YKCTEKFIFWNVFAFALSMILGITPEMLPLIVTTSFKSIIGERFIGIERETVTCEEEMTLSPVRFLSFGNPPMTENQAHNEDTDEDVYAWWFRLTESRAKSEDGGLVALLFFDLRSVTGWVL
ncbi:MAG: hypothetical protein Q8874_02860, partial [Sweet potato little leaf phytoplasma]|nr:hypothetical protein [Sweet potato little leaf phytoplasma]